MPDCQMCWNEWPSLTKPLLPGLPDSVEVCKNCDRGIKKVLSFSRFHGIDLLTGEISGPGPQAGPETPWGQNPDLDAERLKRQGEEEPPSPPAKKPRKAS